MVNITGRYKVKIIKKGDILFGKTVYAYCDGTNSYPWQEEKTKGIYTNRDLKILKKIEKSRKYTRFSYLPNVKHNKV